MPKLFTYGTLKKGHYNHTRFADTLGTEVEAKDTVQNFALVQDNLYYPTAIKEKDHTVIGEVWDITDPVLWKTLERMEIGAGYKMEEVKTTKGHDAIIFYSDRFTKEQLQELNMFQFFPLNELVSPA